MQRLKNSVVYPVWNHDRTKLTVKLPGVTDTILFSPASSGKTDVSITRDEAGKATQIIQVNTPTALLPEPART